MNFFPISFMSLCVSVLASASIRLGKANFPVEIQKMPQSDFIELHKDFFRIAEQQWEGRPRRGGKTFHLTLEISFKYI